MPFCNFGSERRQREREREKKEVDVLNNLILIFLTRVSFISNTFTLRTIRATAAYRQSSELITTNFQTWLNKQIKTQVRF